MLIDEFGSVVDLVVDDHVEVLFHSNCVSSDQANNELLALPSSSSLSGYQARQLSPGGSQASTGQYPGPARHEVEDKRAISPS